MRRTVLTTVSALALALGSSALAQEYDSDLDAGTELQFEGEAGTTPDDATGAQALPAEELIGAAVIGSDGDWIGDVDDVVVDGAEAVSDLVIGSGGILGFWRKQVALPADDVDVQVALDDRMVMVMSALTSEDLDQMPDFEQPPAGHQLYSEVSVPETYDDLGTGGMDYDADAGTSY